MADQIITQEYLREIFDYKDGELYYKKKYARNIKIGKKVGRLNPYGYIYTGLHGKEYSPYAHGDGQGRFCYWSENRLGRFN